jgi:hypothetical protein
MRSLSRCVCHLYGCGKIYLESYAVSFKPSVTRLLWYAEKAMSRKLLPSRNWLTSTYTFAEEASRKNFNVCPLPLGDTGPVQFSRKPIPTDGRGNPILSHHPGQYPQISLRGLKRGNPCIRYRPLSSSTAETDSTGDARSQTTGEQIHHPGPSFPGETAEPRGNDSEEDASTSWEGPQPPCESFLPSPYRCESPRLLKDSR